MSSCAELESFALRVLGNSMEPEFVEGEIIIVEPGSTVEDGCFVVAEYEREYVFRRLEIRNDVWTLKPLNHGYPTLNIDGNSKIRGKVISKSNGHGRQTKHYL